MSEHEEVNSRAAPKPNGAIAITDFDAEDEIVMDVIAPGSDGEKIGTITFAGPGHPKAVELSNTITRRRLREEQQRAANPRRKMAEKTPDEVSQENVHL